MLPTLNELVPSQNVSLAGSDSKIHTYTHTHVHTSRHKVTQTFIKAQVFKENSHKGAIVGITL